MMYVRNDKAGLEFIRKVLIAFPEFKHRNAATFLKQSNGMQFMEL